MYLTGMVWHRSVQKCCSVHFATRWYIQLNCDLCVQEYLEKVIHNMKIHSYPKKHLQIGLIVMKSRIIFELSATATSSANNNTWMPDSLCIIRSCCFNTRLAGISAISPKCNCISVLVRYFSNDSSILLCDCLDFPVKRAIKIFTFTLYSTSHENQTELTSIHEDVIIWTWPSKSVYGRSKWNQNQCSIK